MAAAINLIPVVFNKDEKVRRAYQHFCAVTSPADLYVRYRQLVLEIARSSGFGKNLDEADVDLGFYPRPSVPRPPSESGARQEA